MILKNSKGKERNFKVILRLEKNNEDYLIYQDEISGKYYGGKVVSDKLKSLKDEEIAMLNKILERING